MFRGTVVSIHVTPEPTAAMEQRFEVKAVAGTGLEGDRYFTGIGTFSKSPGAGREVTLIEVEAIEALEREKNISLPPGEARRNLVTRGVPLNHLVGREFQVGEVRLRGQVIHTLGAEKIARGEEKAGPSAHPLPARHAVPPRQTRSNVPSMQLGLPRAKIFPVANQASAAVRRAK